MMATETYKNTARYQKGWASFKLHLGDKAESYIARLEKIYPKFARINIEFPFGDLYADSSVLDERTRELTTIAALTVLGYAGAELQVHVKAALLCGATKNEILEVITQMLAYSGFPSATNALLIAGEVFDSVEEEEKK
jgi:4-carboxymuconolactone decarboxylase